jgi:hypothetical protein
MRKTILTFFGSAFFGSALLAAATVQIAAAAEHKGRRVDRVPPPASEQIRDANAYASFPTVQPNWSRYEGGAVSAPAGR